MGLVSKITPDYLVFRPACIRRLNRDAVIARNPLKGFAALRGCGNGPRD